MVNKQDSIKFNLEKGILNMDDTPFMRTVPPAIMKRFKESKSLPVFFCEIIMELYTQQTIRLSS